MRALATMDGVCPEGGGRLPDAAVLVVGAGGLDSPSAVDYADSSAVGC